MYNIYVSVDNINGIMYFAFVNGLLIFFSCTMTGQHKYHCFNGFYVHYRKESNGAQNW